MPATQTSPRSLPPNPSAEYLRKEAKRLARDNAMQLTAAQSRLAHEYGYRNWAALMTAVARMSREGNGGANPSRPPGSPPISQSGANVFPLLPLRGLVTFPHVTYPIFVGRAKSICAVEHALERKLPIVLAAQKDAANADPLSSDMYQVGVLAKVIQFVRLLDSLVPSVISSLVRRRAKIFGEENPEGWAVAATTADGASMLADRIASELVMDLAWKQALLELLDPAERLEKLLVYLNASS